MTTVYDVAADKLIAEAAKDLKENLKLPRPEWAINAKTGANKERRPDSDDWWWVRAASILRKVYVDGPIGVQRLRVAYGGRKNRGHKPEEFRKASGKVIRTILVDLDKLGLTSKDAKNKEGRTITPKGQAYLDGLAKKCQS
jgi:small subunit ribosomal protein S19e